MLEYLKMKLIKIAQKAEKSNLCKCKSGNFSIRSGKYILITPSGVDRSKLKKEDICVLDINGEFVEIKYGLQPSSEYLMHINIYKKRSEINAIVHTHSKFATTFSSLNKDIPAIVTEAQYILGGKGDIKVAKYGIPGSKKLAEEVLKILNTENVSLMERHGVVTISDIGIEDAFLKAEYVEEIAEIYYRKLVLENLKI